MRVSDKMALRRISGQKGEEVRGDRITFCNENLYNFHSSPDINRVIGAGLAQSIQ
jgi:hypothetical protein